MPIHRHRPFAGVPRARRLRPFFRSLIVLALLAGLGYLFWPSSLGGCSTLTIVSGHSMDPTYATGDLVWSRCGDPAVGDVVVYTPSDADGARVIHRIIGGNGTDGWILQGDNNDFLDPWHPDNSEILGIATVHVPGLGSILYSLGNTWVWASLLIIAAAIFLWPEPAPSGADSSKEPDPLGDTLPPESPQAVDDEMKGALL